MGSTGERCRTGWKQARRRLAAGALASILVSACQATPLPASPSPTAAARPADTPGGTAQPTPAATGTPTEPYAAGMTPLPADIVTSVAAILDAPSAAARVAATQAALERIGITVSGDPAAMPDGPAGIVLAPEDIQRIAGEAADRRASRATLSDFATAVGSMALLPPNDGLAADLPETWLDALPADSSGRVRIDGKAFPGQAAATLNAWVTSAIENHGAADPDLVTLTNAPLLLAELARRRADPIDLAQPFAAQDFRLGWLEITILEGGMRAMLAAAVSSGAVATASSHELLGARSRGGTGYPPRTSVDETPCDLMRQMLDSRVPLASTVIHGYVGAQIKGFIQNFAYTYFGDSASVAQNVSRAFKILGLVFRVQALIMFYSDVRATVEMDPAFYHQPDGSVMRVNAILKAGIDDAAWEAARQARELTPFSTAVRRCAAFVGLPVWQDQVDLGNAMEGWTVQWRLTKGGDRVQIPAGDQFTSGRLERPLTPENDHRGVDAIDYEVLPEKRENHPGDELSEPVEFCAEVFAKEPPGGVGTILSSGFAGASLAGGAYLGLIAAIAKLLTEWIATISGVEGCGQATVSYHVPLPGQWKGTVTANTYRHEEVTSTITENLGPSLGTTVTTGTTEVTVDVTSKFYVSGTDREVGAASVLLTARVFTHGAASFTYYGSTMNGWTSSGCNYDEQVTTDTGGGWSSEDDGGVGISLSTDGTYRINPGMGLLPDVFLDGEHTIEASVKTPTCEDHASGSSVDHQFVEPGQPFLGDLPVGHVDPANPGNRLQGTMTFYAGNGWTTTVTWDLVHETPIILPKPFVGGG